jgi:hypothetical protein
MYHKDALIKSLEGGSPDVPMVGDVAFFVGADQPYKSSVFLCCHLLLVVNPIGILFM